MSTCSPVPRPPDLPAESAGELVRLIDALDLLDRLWQLPADGGPPGDVSVGRFSVRSRVGAGRFGVVFRADDPVLGRAVVVKVPQPAVLADPDLRERFVREARAAGRLDHPGVVPVHEAGDDRGLPYLAAGLVDGPSLAAWLADRPGSVPPPGAARLVERLAAAVHHAHERGVLHCDLKPANILLAIEPPLPADGLGRPADLHAVEVAPGVRLSPRVTDFGLARLVEDDPALTRTFQVAGTPLYMAPEQARGDRRALTSRADVYALGAILYELLTGNPPFAGGPEAEVQARLQAGSPADPATARPGVPRDLAAVCLKCLENDPARRYATADDLADDLRRFLAGRSVQARRAGAARRLARAARRHPLTASLAASTFVLVATLVGLLFQTVYARLEHDVALREAERTAAVERFHARLAAVRERRVGFPYSGWAADSLADLRELAAAPPAADHRADLRSEAAAALAATDLRPVRAIDTGFAAYCPVFSPDGGTLAVGGWRAGPDSHGHVRLFDPATGRLVQDLAFPLAEGWDPEGNRADGCRAIEYSPDGRWLVAGTRAGGLVRWDARDWAAPPVAWPGHAADPVPANRRAVYALTFTADVRELYSATSVTARRWDVAAGWAAAGTWADAAAPHGTRAFGADPVLFVVDPAGYHRLGRPAPDGGREPFKTHVFESVFAVAPGGRLAAVVTGVDHELALSPLVPAASAQPFVVPGRPRNVRIPLFDVEFRADAAVLATSGEHDRRVRLWDVAGGTLAADRVVGEGSGRLSFAPDGHTLAVAEGDRVVVYEVTGRVREAVGAGPWEQLDGFAAAPDGGAVTTFHATPDHATEAALWTAPGASAGARVFPNTLTDARAADVSPDGRTVVHVHLVGRGERVVAEPGGGVATERVNDLRFGPDGRLWAADAHRVRVWTLPGWAEERQLENDADAVAGGVVFRAVAPGRGVTLVGRRDGRVFRLPAGSGEWQPFPAPVTALTLSADETRAAAGGEGGEVVLLDLAAGTATPVPGAHRDAVRSVAFSPGGWLVTGSADGTMKVWAADGTPLMSVPTGGGVRKLALSRDGAVLTVLVEGERAVRRWRLDRLRHELAALGLDWDGP